MRCDRCFETIEDKAIFCHRCGKKIEKQENVIKNINGVYLNINKNIPEEDIIIISDEISDILELHFKDGIDRRAEWGYAWCKPDKIPEYMEIDTDPNVQSSGFKRKNEEIKYLNQGELVLCRCPKRLMDARREYNRAKSYKSVYNGMKRYNDFNVNISRSDGLQEKIQGINRNMESIGSIDQLTENLSNILND